MTDSSFDIKIATLGLQKKLEEPGLSDKKCFVGVDGFVDSIYHIVKERKSAQEYQRFETIADYAKGIAAASGKSGNMELVLQEIKVGGNGPILSSALLEVGLNITYLGALGDPEIHPVFKEFSEKCSEVLSLTEAAYTDAFEFRDGKMMMGKHESLHQITWSSVVEKVGLEKLRSHIQQTDLLILTNWSMVVGLTEILSAFIEKVLPSLNKKTRPIFFIDLCDPAKRPQEDLKKVLQILGEFENFCQGFLGLNRREAEQVSDVLGLDHFQQSSEDLCSEIRKSLKLSGVVIHSREFAVMSTKESSCTLAIPFTENPKRTTGAGDNFNAGLTLALLAGASPEEALICGMGFSGYYVRSGKSPNKADLLNFLTHWAKNPNASEDKLLEGIYSPSESFKK